MTRSERRLETKLRGLWGEVLPLVPYPVRMHDAAERDAVTMPYLQSDGLRLPEVLDDRAGVPALLRYRAMLAHLAGHRRWRRPQVADNRSPLQRLGIEYFKDARIDHLVLRRFPGLAPTLLALHPTPDEDGCDPGRESCLRHRLACLSRALLDPPHRYRSPVLGDFVRRFHALVDCRESSTAEMAALALEWSAATRCQSDQLAQLRFDDTRVDWRDDNRHLWTCIEQGDEEDTQGDSHPPRTAVDDGGLPPRHYPEWDAAGQAHRPDWVSVETWEPPLR